MAFIKSSKNQVWTLPPDIRDLIPSDHICYLVEFFVDETDFSEFEYKLYKGTECKILVNLNINFIRELNVKNVNSAKSVQKDGWN